MIVIDDTNTLLKAQLYAEVTLADYRELEQAVDRRVRAGKRVDLLLDLTNMAGFTVDVAWEDIKYTRAHARDFGRIAVVTPDQWLSWLGWLATAFTDAQIETFPESADAQAWLSAA